MLTCSDYPPPGNTVVEPPVDLGPYLGPQGHSHQLLTQADSFGPDTYEHAYRFAGDSDEGNFRPPTNGCNIFISAGTPSEPGNVGDTFGRAMHQGDPAHPAMGTSPALSQVSHPTPLERFVVAQIAKGTGINLVSHRITSKSIPTFNPFD